MCAEKRHRILLADDHTILRDALKCILGSRPEFEVVGEAADGREAIQRTRELQPDLVLMDLSMPRTSGLEALREIRRLDKRTRVLILTANDAEQSILEAFRAGANGYVLKDTSSADLLAAMKVVLSGEHFLSPAITTRALAAFRHPTEPRENKPSHEDLTRRQREVLKLVAEGFQTRGIAEYLFISPKTVERHRASLMNRLGLHGIAELTAYGIRCGLVAS